MVDAFPALSLSATNALSQSLSLDARSAVEAYVDWAGVVNGFSIYTKNHTQAIGAAKGALCAFQSCFSDLIFVSHNYMSRISTISLQLF